jgi:biotin transport system substrate-specific component
MSALTPAAPRPVLADLIPRTHARNAALVVGAALLTAASAQIAIPLPFSPVPLSGQTFAVLLTAAALGPARGALGQGLYVLLGMAGLPFYAGGESGVQVAVGATGGYLFGFIVAALVIGALARRGLDRTPHGMALAFVAGSLTIYALGVPWLAVATGMSLGQALINGAVVFVVGDAIKAALAAGVLPAAWRIAQRD